MTILVTGALGFVGINVVRHLAATHPDRRIMAVDLQPPDPESLAFLAGFANIGFSRLDVTDRAQCRAVAVEARGGDVVHAAADTPLPSNGGEARLRTFDINLGGTLNMMEAAAKAAIRRVVLLSSSGVYAETTLCGPPLSEDATLDLSNAYAASKRSAEIAAEFYARSGAILTAALRLGSVYGPMERSRPSRPATSLVARLIAADRPTTLWGAEIARDWIHADDIGAAVDALLGTAQSRHGVYNVGSGALVSAGRLAAILNSHGVPVRIADEEQGADIKLRPQDGRAALSIARLKAETGFEPRVGITEGLAALIAAANPR